MTARRSVWPPAAPVFSRRTPNACSSPVARLCACGRRIEKRPGRGRWPSRCNTCRGVPSSRDPEVFFEALRDLLRST